MQWNLFQLLRRSPFSQPSRYKGTTFFPINDKICRFLREFVCILVYFPLNTHWNSQSSLLCKATGGRALALQASRAGADIELLIAIESQTLRVNEVQLRYEPPSIHVSVYLSSIPLRDGSHSLAFHSLISTRLNGISLIVESPYSLRYLKPETPLPMEEGH